MTQAAREQGSVGRVPFAGGEGIFFQLRRFAGINTREDRTDINDEEFSWLENLMPIADGSMRATYSNAAPIWNAGAKTIIYFKMFNIGATQYAAVFYSNGTADQIDMTGTKTVITGTANTFYNGGDLPSVAQWASSGIIIVTTAASNGYYAWDGTLHSPGDATSPTWLNGGTPTAMPTGVKGTYVETFQARVWIVNGSNGVFSAPGNGADFNSADGSGSFPSTDSFLRQRYVAVKQSNGFLYLFGDSSINVISNVQTGGSPVTTTFNNQNVDPQVGTPWPGTVQAFSRGLVFANPTGVYALYGGSAEKVSEQLDGLFEDADFVSVTPTAAVAVIFEIKCYCLLFKTTDFSGVSRNVVACWTGRKWFLITQNNALSFIDTQEINSNIFAWGTDGKNLFQMLQAPSTTLRKIMQTKLWSGEGYVINKQAMRAYCIGTDHSGNGFSLAGTLDMISDQGNRQSSVTLALAPQAIVWLNNSGQIITWVNNSSQVITFTGGSSLQIFGQDLTGFGAVLGFTLLSFSSDFELSALSLLYRRMSAIGG